MRDLDAAILLEKGFTVFCAGIVSFYEFSHIPVKGIKILTNNGKETDVRFFNLNQGLLEYC